MVNMTIQPHNLSYVIPNKSVGFCHGFSAHILRILQVQIPERYLVKDKVWSIVHISAKNIHCPGWYYSQYLWCHDSIQDKFVVPPEVCLETWGWFLNVKLIGLCKLKYISISKVMWYLTLKCFPQILLSLIKLLLLKRIQVVPSEKYKSSLSVILSAYIPLFRTEKPISFQWR